MAHEPEEEIGIFISLEQVNTIVHLMEAICGMFQEAIEDARDELAEFPTLTLVRKPPDEQGH